MSSEATDRTLATRTRNNLAHYGDNNETPTMPATCLADHDVLAIPAGRHLARKHTPCYWRQLSLDTPREVKRTCPPLHEGVPQWPWPLLPRMAADATPLQRHAHSRGTCPLPPCAPESPPRPSPAYRPQAPTMGARPTRTLGLDHASRCARPSASISVVENCLEPSRNPPGRTRRGDVSAHMASHLAAREGAFSL
jgi:hypothetical protein